MPTLDVIATHLEKEKLSYWRSVIGDGDCYWRCVIFSYLENLILENNLVELTNLVNQYNYIVRYNII